MKKYAVLISLLLVGWQAIDAQVSARLFRYPDVSDKHIVFTYGGDLWIVDKNGGTASKLSSPSGTEGFARFSPDGSQILFSEGAASVVKDWVTYLRGTDGSPAVRLGEGLAAALSADGKWAMLSPTGAKLPLIAFPTRAGNPETLAAGEIRHFGGRWTGDGGRIVFVGAEPGRRRGRLG